MLNAYVVVPELLKIYSWSSGLVVVKLSTKIQLKFPFLSTRFKWTIPFRRTLPVAFSNIPVAARMPNPEAGFAGGKLAVMCVYGASIATASGCDEVSLQVRMWN